MGLAFAELHWSPDAFWASTVRELLTAYAYAYPSDEINTAKHVPFTDEEKQILKDIRTKVELDRKLKNDSKH